MGIYIKGMELPECCDKCPFKKYIGSDLLVCKITGYRFYVWEVGWGDKPYVRHESCPLTEIPPHGRLIDADALKDKWTHKDLDLFSQGWGWLRGLNQAPTIIPASKEGET